MSTPWIVVDVGNSALHFGQFDTVATYTEPSRVLRVPCASPDFQVVDDWLAVSSGKSGLASFCWKIGSVNPEAESRLRDWILSRGESAQTVSIANLPISTSVKNPMKVGIDRLAGATAANQLRPGIRPAIIVDAGTAITIDCVSSDGVFLGGAIAPGLGLSFQTLNRNTAQLPLSQIKSTPCLVGNSTETAIQSGVYWLTVGGIDSLIHRLQQELASPCSVYVTGGSMPTLLRQLSSRVEYYPHLVLSGLALAGNE